MGAFWNIILGTLITIILVPIIESTWRKWFGIQIPTELRAGDRTNEKQKKIIDYTLSISALFGVATATALYGLGWSDNVLTILMLGGSLFVVYPAISLGIMVLLAGSFENGLKILNIVEEFLGTRKSGLTIVVLISLILGAVSIYHIAIERSRINTTQSTSNYTLNLPDS